VDIFTLLVFPHSSFLTGALAPLWGEVVDFSGCMWEAFPIFLLSGHPIDGPMGTYSQEPGIIGKVREIEIQGDYSLL